MHDRRTVLDWNCMEKDTFGEGYTHEEDGETFLFISFLSDNQKFCLTPTAMCSFGWSHGKRLWRLAKFNARVKNVFTEILLVLFL